MKTITSILQQMTNPKAIIHELRETLRVIDPEFFDTEVKFLAASVSLEKELGNTITPSVSEYLAAKEEEFAAEVIYIGWLGFQLNLDIFNNPINALLLKGDFEELLRERRLGTLPMAKKPREVLEAFHSETRILPEAKCALIDEITSFYSYLETTGYKIAHYFGFRLADHFLQYVIPGYTSDTVNTLQYSSQLCDYLQIDLDRLE